VSCWVASRVRLKCAHRQEKTQCKLQEKPKHKGEEEGRSIGVVWALKSGAGRGVGNGENLAAPHRNKRHTTRQEGEEECYHTLL